jgi:predicted dehydrogenase
MAGESLNVALVGCGIFGEIHASTYAAFEQSNLVAVCDIDEAKAKAFAERFGGRACTSVAEIAADGDIQAVSVATPDFAHRDACLAVLEAGKHLLVEKPLATDIADARAIVDAAHAAGVVAMIDFHNRYNPAFAAIRDRLDKGELGRPQMLFARLSDRIEVATEWFPWSARTGPEWFLGAHAADLACWLFGEDPVRVFAEGRKDVLAARGIDCYDAMHIHLSFPAGFATIENSWILPNTWPMVCDFFVSLQTTETRADVDLSHQGVTLAEPTEYARPFLYGKTPVGVEDFGFMSFPIRDFVRAVLAGAPSPVPLAAGLKNVQILAAAVQSAETGQVVDLEP